MTPLSLHHLARLDELFATGTPPAVAFPQAIGGTCVYDGIWRFFSDSWPEGGISRWNNESIWKVQWQPFLPRGLFSFGEDVFGNQLALVGGHENVFLWNHENGDCHDLLLGPCALLRTSLESGIDWIDFYSDDSLALAKQHGSVPFDSHLHWITPLILGGQVSSGNITLLQREPHLGGHAQLWSQVGGLPPGTTIIPR